MLYASWLHIESPSRATFHAAEMLLDTCRSLHQALFWSFPNSVAVPILSNMTWDVSIDKDSAETYWVSWPDCPIRTLAQGPILCMSRIGLQEVPNMSEEPEYGDCVNLASRTTHLRARLYHIILAGFPILCFAHVSQGSHFLFPSLCHSSSNLSLTLSSINCSQQFWLISFLIVRRNVSQSPRLLLPRWFEWRLSCRGRQAKIGRYVITDPYTALWRY